VFVSGLLIEHGKTKLVRQREGCSIPDRARINVILDQSSARCDKNQEGPGFLNCSPPMLDYPAKSLFCLNIFARLSVLGFPRVRAATRPRSRRWSSTRLARGTVDPPVLSLQSPCLRVYVVCGGVHGLMIFPCCLLMIFLTNLPFLDHLFLLLFIAI
jgi:hypothetical protein